MTTYTISWLS